MRIADFGYVYVKLMQFCNKSTCYVTFCIPRGSTLLPGSHSGGEKKVDFGTHSGNDLRFTPNPREDWQSSLRQTAAILAAPKGGWKQAPLVWRYLWLRLQALN
jgi:hypothetical protein